ncbi:MAG TPA: ABC transporter ATP-binding protein [Bacilli bacterium]|jgi:ATP-binding cassette subfamily B multidrug efflux pump|nr:ABC transporter ATP-binding protein [Bacilli bacterium]HOD61472.1 ABC transporter ATP-binding protein [Bacilli bacterium]HOH61478.1 ABC transporter ATP-binding protein [Bacilli bacterium]HPB49463.1 ABC transporter ATP-binding protein [Bacilli bacterium]HPM14376.1 ABC transporter ATP-binding protein [Bacilli bacterium]
MKKILKYLKPYWFLALLAPIFMGVEVFFELLQPKLMEKIVDNGVLSTTLNLSEKIDVVLNTGLLMLLCVAIAGIGGILSAAFASTAANSFGNDVRKAVFSRVVDLSFEQKDKFTTGSLITRITNDVTQVQNFIMMSIRMFVRTILLFVGGIVMMYITSPKFAMVLGVILPIQVLIIIYFLRKALPIFKQVQNKIDTVNSIVQENVNGVRVVKAYTREDYESKKFARANEDLSLTTLKVQKILAIVNPLMTIFLYIIVVAIIYLGAQQIHIDLPEILNNTGNPMTVGKVMAGLTYIFQILMSVIMLAMIVQSVTRAKVSIDRLNAVLDSNPTIMDCDEYSRPSQIGTVEYRNVNFNYPNLIGKPVISNFNLKIEKGESLAILGSTGSGKSSLVNLIPRFYDATSGAVLVNGVNVKEYHLQELREKIGIVLQQAELFSGTIKENLLWGDENASEEELVHYAKIAQADDFIRSFTDGYDTVISEKGASLSGGQKQRISIARALLKKPEILIFDDATSALDLATEANLYQALRANLQDTTLIIIAQRVASAKNADKIAIIDNGTLVACDTHDVLFKTCAIYQDIYNSQLRRGEEDEQ